MQQKPSKWAGGGINVSGEAPFEIRGFSLANAAALVGLATGTSSYGVGLRPKVSTRVGVPCRRRCIVCLSVLRDGPCARTRLKPLSGVFVSRRGFTGVMSSTTGSGPGFAVRAGRLVARMTYRSTCSSCWAWSFRRGFSWFCVLNDRRRGVTAFCCGG